MSSSSQVEAEILRLSRLLRVDRGELDFLTEIDASELRAFRHQVTDALFDSGHSMFKRLASATKLLPASVLAKIAQSVFGPLLCARIAGVIDEEKAAEVARRLNLEFLTDVAAELDPRRTQGVISKIAPETVVAVTTQLAQRKDWITLGRFVGYLPSETLAPCFDAVDDEAVLRTAFVVEDVSAIPTVIDVMTPQRLAGLLHAATEANLWSMLLGITDHLRDDQLIDLAEGVRELTPEARSAIAREAEALGVLSTLGPLAEVLTERAA